jgi:translocator protein
MSFLDFPDEDPKRRARRPMLLFILVALAVGALGSVFAEPNIATWYAALVHPVFAPPNWLFAPVWTALYILMAVAAWRVWRVTGLKSPAMISYAVQLALNLGWSVLFFGLHQIGLALVEIGLLELAILATTILFWRVDRIAGLLMLPYLAWTGFAAVLNLAFGQLNV